MVKTVRCGRINEGSNPSPHSTFKETIMKLLGFVIDVDYVCVYCGQNEFDARGLEYNWHFCADDIYEDVELIWPEDALEITHCIRCGQSMEIVNV